MTSRSLLGVYAACVAARFHFARAAERIRRAEAIASGVRLVAVLLLVSTACACDTPTRPSNSVDCSSPADASFLPAGVRAACGGLR